MRKLIWDNFFKAVILELCINIGICIVIPTLIIENKSTS
jgi:hypothetical protein